MLQNDPLCVQDAPLQSATLEMPAESIFGDLDSEFLRAWITVPPSKKLNAYGDISRCNRRHKLVKFCLTLLPTGTIYFQLESTENTMKCGWR